MINLGCLSLITDEQMTGFDPLEPYYSVGNMNNEIDITSGDSLNAINLQLYQLIDRALNPWLLFNQVAVRLNSALKTIVGDESTNCPTRLTLPRSEFLRIAVPMFKPSTKERDETSLDESVSLIHYDDKLRKLLDVDVISISL